MELVNEIILYVYLGVVFVVWILNYSQESGHVFMKKPLRTVA